MLRNYREFQRYFRYEFVVAFVNFSFFQSYHHLLFVLPFVMLLYEFLWLHFMMIVLWSNQLCWIRK